MWSLGHRGQSTTIFLWILPFSAWWVTIGDTRTNDQTNKQTGDPIASLLLTSVRRQSFTNRFSYWEYSSRRCLFVNSGLDALQIHVVMHFYCTTWCCRANCQISTVVSDACPDLNVEVLAVSLGREEYQLLFFLFLPSCCYSLLRAN